MPETVLIVEGHGDVASFPHLVGKISNWLGLLIFAKKPIRAGCWGAIKKPGGLERLVALAASREDCTKIVVIVDLDDGCPVDERLTIEERAQNLANHFGVSIEICFCVREFEAWYLRTIDLLVRDFPELEDLDHQEIIDSAHTHRDAKGKLREFLADGYSESIDQAALLTGIDPAILYGRDRSFRRFVKAVSGLDYDILEEAQ